LFFFFSLTFRYATRRHYYASAILLR
jgi:hypothetical protein